VVIFQRCTKEIEDCHRERDELNDTISHLKQVCAACQLMYLC